MPPQNQSSSPAPSGSSDPNYNFIFNGDQKPKKRFSLPGGSRVTKLAFLIIGGGAIVGILIMVLSSIFISSGVDSKGLTDIVARAQEIGRVSDLVAKNSRDPNTLNMATTTSNTLTSQQLEIIDYLKTKRIKISSKDIRIYEKKDTEAAIQNEAQNNRLSEYYYAYLKKNLTDYQTHLNTAFNNTDSVKLKGVLQQSGLSTKTILSTQQIATASSVVQ